MVLATMLLNAVLAVSPAVPAVTWSGGSFDIPLTPCRFGAWWDGLCTETCEARICVWVSHYKLVCGRTVVFDLGWIEVSVEEDGKPPVRCGIGIGDLKKGGPYERRTYLPPCGDDRLVIVDVSWLGDVPDIRAISCVER